jgi:hypothetical protein
MFEKFACGFGAIHPTKTNIDVITNTKIITIPIYTKKLKRKQSTERKMLKRNKNTESHRLEIQ